MKGNYKHSRLAGLPKSEAKRIENNINSFFTILKKRRNKLGMSQEELAEILNISVGTIKGIEQCIRTPSLVMLVRMSEALGLKISLK